MSAWQTMEREGPVFDDEGGELVPSILSCRSCKHLRRHDFHYTFCAAQGGKPSYWSAGEPVVQLHRGAYPNEGCPFPAPPQKGESNARLIAEPEKVK